VAVDLWQLTIEQFVEILTGSQGAVILDASSGFA
jgi:hypothetical protein